MSRRARIAILVPALLGLAALLGWSVAGLPHFGHYRGPYGFVLDRVAVPERHATNVVSATVFDYRGIDTLGEELILFAAVTGVVLLLRDPAREAGAGKREQTGRDALRLVGGLSVGAVVLIGLWLVAFGYVTPGGGFQGGVLVAGGALLLYLAAGYRAFGAFRDERILDPLEAFGAGGFVIVGLAALASGLAFLQNLFAAGEVGTLVSGGSIPFLNWAAGIEVAAALLVLFAEFLEEYIVPLARGGERS